MYYPDHIGIIPDGNRTWARKNDYNKIVGHYEGFKRANEIVKYLLGNDFVKCLTFWGLSTENKNKRSDEELEYLFELYKKGPQEMYDFMKENKINFRWIGKEEGLPKHLIDFLKDKQKELDFGSDRNIVFAVNYGGRDEILEGFKDYLNSCNDKNEALDNLSTNTLSSHLWLGDLPNIDLLIRTKGDIAKRLSGFMLWWIGYAELYFSDKLCPELDEDEIDKALNWFNNICTERNFGK